MNSFHKGLQAPKSVRSAGTEDKFAENVIVHDAVEHITVCETEERFGCRVSLLKETTDMQSFRKAIELFRKVYVYQFHGEEVGMPELIECFRAAGIRIKDDPGSHNCGCADAPYDELSVDEIADIEGALVCS